jgi:hypothetical protein
MKLPIFRAFGASWALLFSETGTLVRAVWLPLLLLQAASSALMPDYMHKQLELAGMGSQPDPAAAMSVMGEAFGAMGLLYLAAAVFWPMAIAGNLRHIIRGDKPRLPFYLNYGPDEFRILGAYILMIIMFTLLMIVGMLGAMVIGFVAALAPKAAGLVGLVAVLVGVGALVWFVIRLSLTMPATIGARRIGIAHSFRVTKGNSLRLLVYFIVWGLIFVVAACVYLVVAMPEFFEIMREAMAAAGDPAAQQEMERRMIEAQLEMWEQQGAKFWVYSVATYVFTLLYVVAGNVATGVAYRYIAGEATKP